MKKALILGVSGQDGSYLSELLLEEGYRVNGMIRRSSVDTTERIQHILDNDDFILHYGDMADIRSLISLIEKTAPDEIYNLAAQSDVGLSFGLPEVTGDITGLGVLRILEAMRVTNSKARFYQASSSEMFGKVMEIPQRETTPFYPRSPYGVAKLYGYWITRNYREAYDMHASNGILFNHESPRRGDNFVTQKIVKGLVKIYKREQDCLYLGNLDSRRDWGHAKDYVKAMHLMLQQDVADDYVIATGEAHSVRDFVEATANYLGINMAWRGSNLDEVGVDTKTDEILIRINKAFWRPTEVDTLLGEAFKAKEKLGWVPSYNFESLVKDMVDHQFECYINKKEISNVI